MMRITLSSFKMIFIQSALWLFVLPTVLAWEFFYPLPDAMTSLPAAITDVLTDSRDGQAVTLDVTSSVWLPNLIDTKNLEDSFTGSSSSGYCVVGTSGDVSGNPGNVLAYGAHPLSDGVNHWRFIGVGSAEFGCGMSDAAHFASGWGIKGLYLTSNGNLAGQGALKLNFVNNFPVPRVIDYYLEVSGNVVDAYIVVNGIPSGHAFHLTFPDPAVIAQLRPMVTYLDVPQGQQTVILDFPTVPNTGMMPYKSMNATPPTDPTQCTWRLKTGDTGSAILRTDGDRISIQVANTMSVPATFNSDGSVSVQGTVVSTKMMPPPHLQALEQRMAQLLETMTEWTIEDGRLTLTSPTIGGTLWVPYAGDQEAVTENPFVNP
eukprot:Blabericola_migrator_1__1551@NODE_140_length_13109_cov_183_610106_g122_i0_p4_GENE_NODE_140_length_13109_cov_183_610106_g122_i0NODE_140_length_13109_cov_183_610106_g122_i0_p4_ORF_typecomplete_len375_score55_16META/PF03724_16/9_5e11_NODE_140_length_13109_cov_183_610106_g122_i039835107